MFCWTQLQWDPRQGYWRMRWMPLFQRPLNQTLPLLYCKWLSSGRVNTKHEPIDYYKGRQVLAGSGWHYPSPFPGSFNTGNTWLWFSRSWGALFSLKWLLTAHLMLQAFGGWLMYQKFISSYFLLYCISSVASRVAWYHSMTCNSMMKLPGHFVFKLKKTPFFQLFHQ